jgi:glycerophosphoryl diester phosphodiesterase
MHVPENSVAAFRAALAVSAGIETDLRLSADGVPMVFHDRDAMRLCGSPAVCSATSADELGALRLSGGEERIPRLSDLLALAGGHVPLLLELKTDGDAARLARAVAETLRAYPGPVGMMSFDPRVGAWLAAHRPGIRRGLVLSGRGGTLSRWAAMWRARPQFLAVDRTLLSRRWVTAARRRIPVYSWTIRSPEQRAQASVHADALIWEADGRP